MASSSDFDKLTGVFSRRAVPAHANNGTLALFVDVDGMIWVNDEHGHIVGDGVLIRVAEILGRMFPANVFRVGGDEFLVQLRDPSTVAARSAAGEVIHAIHELAIDYRRADRPARDRVEVNVVMFILDTETVAKNFVGEGAAYALSDQFGSLIYEEKLRSGRDCAVVVDATCAPDASTSQA